MTQRLNFYDIFKINEKGMIEPLQIVRVGTLQFGPGVSLGGGVTIGKISLNQLIGKDLEVKEKNGILIVTGIF